MSEKEKKQLRAVVKEPGKPAEVRMLTDEYTVYRELVGGLIETVPLPDIEGVIAVLNEEGKLINLDPNIFLPEYNDLLVGTFLVVGDSRYGDFKSLTAAQIEQVTRYIAANDASGYERGEDEFVGFEVYASSDGDGKIPFMEILFGEKDGGAEM